MPDTPALQERFGQPTVQRPGCGFPMAHLLGLFHAGTGMLLKLVLTHLLTHDLAQRRRSIRAYNPVTCSRPIGVCVLTLISPASTRLARMPCCAWARDRLSISHPVGPLSGRVCAGRLPSKAFHDPNGSQR
jgi:hypothetical protein